jgi:hypothetical protein
MNKLIFIIFCNHLFLRLYQANTEDLKYNSVVVLMEILFRVLIDEKRYSVDYCYWTPETVKPGSEVESMEKSRITRVIKSLTLKN